MTTDKRKQLVESLKNKEYRDALVAENVGTGLAFQIRLLRDARKWNQEDLAKAAGKAQPTVSQLEDPNYGRHSLTTLKKLASAFDVALLVKFVSFSRFVDETLELTQEVLAPKSFDQDVDLYKESLPVVHVNAVAGWSENAGGIWATAQSPVWRQITFSGALCETADQNYYWARALRPQALESGPGTILHENVMATGVGPERKLNIAA